MEGLLKITSHPGIPGQYTQHFKEPKLNLGL